MPLTPREIAEGLRALLDQAEVGRRAQEDEPILLEEPVCYRPGQPELNKHRGTVVLPLLAVAPGGDPGEVILSRAGAFTLIAGLVSALEQGSAP